MKTYFYTDDFPGLICANIHGLLIRGIHESRIKTIEAESRWDAGFKIAELNELNELKK